MCLCEGLPALITTFPQLHKESLADFAIQFCRQQPEVLKVPLRERELMRWLETDDYVRKMTKKTALRKVRNIRGKTLRKGKLKLRRKAKRRVLAGVHEKPPYLVFVYAYSAVRVQLFQQPTYPSPLCLAIWKFDNVFTEFAEVQTDPQSFWSKEVWIDICLLFFFDSILYQLWYEWFFPQKYFMWLNCSLYSRGDISIILHGLCSKNMQNLSTKRLLGRCLELNPQSQVMR